MDDTNLQNVPENVCGHKSLRFSATREICTSNVLQTLMNFIVSWTATVCLQNFLVYLLLRLQAIDRCLHRVGQIKRGQLTFLLVTSIRTYKIKWFLAGVNYVDQRVTWCHIFSWWKCNTLEGATSIITMLQADRPICKESHVVLPSAENNMRVILTKKTGSYSPENDYSTF